MILRKLGSDLIKNFWENIHATNSVDSEEVGFLLPKPELNLNTRHLAHGQKQDISESPSC